MSPTRIPLQPNMERTLPLRLWATVNKTINTSDATIEKRMDALEWMVHNLPVRPHLSVPPPTPRGSDTERRVREDDRGLVEDAFGDGPHREAGEGAPWEGLGELGRV